MIDERLFTLLRIGLKIGGYEEEDLTSFIGMTNEQWGILMNTAQEQGVLGLGLDGVEAISSTIQLPKQPNWLFESYNGALLRESLNKKQQDVIGELCCIWGKHGIKMLLLKGQANGLFYPNPLHRDCGDIDCYLFDQYEKGNFVIRELGIVVNEDWEKHSEFSYKGEVVENHQFFVQTLDKKWWKSLHSDLLSLVSRNINHYPDSEVLVAPVLFNALFLTYHAMEHFLAGNLKLKQITDWVMFLKSEKDNVNWEELNRLCMKYNMYTFLCIMNSIASSRFGIHLEQECVNHHNMKEGLRLLNAVFNDKDFIWDNSAGRWHGRFHYLNHVIKNRWKYRIAGRSMFKTLWYYISSYKERN